jgi:hypothetical protein
MRDRIGYRAGRRKLGRRRPQVNDGRARPTATGVLERALTAKVTKLLAF